MKRGPLCVLGCYILWGLLPVFWKTLSSVNSAYVLAARIVWSLVFLTAVLAGQRRLREAAAVLRDRSERRRLLLSGACICVNWGLYIWAVNSSHMLDASLAYYMNPIMVIFLGTLLFQEKLTRLQWLSVAVTFAGLITVIIRCRQFPWLAIMIGASFAFYGAVKKNVRAEAGISTFIETLFLTPAALIFMIAAEARGAGAVGVLHGAQWLLLPASGIATTVPLLLYSHGLKTTPLSVSGILMYVNPTLQLLISVLLYGEDFTATHAILFGFVWTGVALYLLSALLRGRERRKENPPCAS